MRKPKPNRVKFNLNMPEEIHKELSEISSKTKVSMTDLLIDGGITFARIKLKKMSISVGDYRNM